MSPWRAAKLRLPGRGESHAFLASAIQAPETMNRMAIATYGTRPWCGCTLYPTA